MNKKAIWIKISIMFIQIVPIVVFLILNWNEIFNTPSKSIGLGLIWAIITAFLIFKDAVTKFYKTPGVLKFVLTVFVISGISLLVGETLFEISIIELCAVAVSVPLQILYNHITRPVEARDLAKFSDDLKEILLGSKKGESESVEEDKKISG